MEYYSIGQLAIGIVGECLAMEKKCNMESIPPPSLEAGAKADFWSETLPEIRASRANALEMIDMLTTLLQGPHEFLHDFVSCNWDVGSLYTFLQSQALEYIHSSNGRCASLSNLSKQTEIPEDKLARILALLRCKHIVNEPTHGVFTLTAVSEELMNDGDFRAWVEFQLFETRIASAYLSEALMKKPNGFEDGTSGFKHGFGMEMYDWHATHREKGDRFRRAMRGVSKSLDPADALIRQWFQQNGSTTRSKVVEIGGRYGFASISLVGEKSGHCFEIRCDSQTFLDHDDANTVLVYIIRNVLWNWTNNDAAKLIRTLLRTLESSPSARIIVTDGVSPSAKEFSPRVESAYRRRDVTMMTMHNVKQRTQAEWLDLFSGIDSSLMVTSSSLSSSHVCKGLWELSLVDQSLLP